MFAWVTTYQVCEKWLKDRQAKGGKNPCPSRVLNDEVIKEYWGWPGPFVTEASDTETGTYPSTSDMDVPMAAEGRPEYGQKQD